MLALTNRCESPQHQTTPQLPPITTPRSRKVSMPNVSASILGTPLMTSSYEHKVQREHLRSSAIISGSLLILFITIPALAYDPLAIDKSSSLPAPQDFT